MPNDQITPENEAAVLRGCIASGHYAGLALASAFLHARVAEMRHIATTRPDLAHAGLGGMDSLRSAYCALETAAESLDDLAADHAKRASIPADITESATRMAIATNPVSFESAVAQFAEANDIERATAKAAQPAPKLEPEISHLTKH